MSDTLPALVSSDGEVIRALTAEDLLRAAGILDPRIAELGTLAQFALDADHLASLVSEAKTLASDELVHRLDKLGRWTVHQGDLTVKSSSPAAGTNVYDSERLALALAPLVADGTLDPEAVTAAVEWVEPPPPAPHWSQKPGGIKRLLSLGGKVAEAVLSAHVPTTPPRRAAKVSRRSS